MPLWGVNAKNTLLPAVNFTTTFAPCPSQPLPKRSSGPGHAADLPGLPRPEQGDAEGASATGPARSSTRSSGPAGSPGPRSRSRPPKPTPSQKPTKKPSAKQTGAPGRRPRDPVSRDLAHRAALGPLRGGDARRARADGRDHQRGLPAAVPRAGGRALRLRDDHLAGARRARRDDAADAGLRRARGGPLGPALRHRPGLRRARPPRSSAPSTASRTSTSTSAVRSPRSPARAAVAHCRGSAGCSATSSSTLSRAAEPYGVPVTMKTRKGIDDDHLTYLDAGRIAQESGVRGHRPARPDRGPGLLRGRRLVGDRRAGRTTSTSRCSATATSGRPRTRVRDGAADRCGRRGGRPGLPGSPVAVP